MKATGYSSLVIVLCYLFFGIAWILLSDQAVQLVFPLPAEHTQIQTYKGWLFIVITALLLYILLDARDRRIEKAQEQLTENEQRWHYALQGSGDGVFDWDLVSNRVYYSDRWKEMLGYDESDISDSFSEWENRLHPDDHDRIVQELSSYITGTVQHYNIEHRLRCKDNSYKWIIASGKIMTRDENGKPLRMVGTHKDISDRKQAEESMARAEKLESLGVLAGGIAHDFNNLLAGIFGYLDMALSYSKGNQRVSELLEKCLGAFGRAKDLTQQLLTFSKGSVPHKQTAAISPVLTESVGFALSGSNVQCKFELDENLWLVDFDSNQISQVIDNLVINAIQAMPQGGTITISAQNMRIDRELSAHVLKGRYVVIKITDQGYGIPSEILDKIFDPFFTTKEHGSGLGLATSFSIVKKHGGFLDVTSRVGEGTTFTIYLPASGDQQVVSNDIPQPLNNAWDSSSLR